MEVDIDQLADITGWSRTTIYRYIKNDDMPIKKRGKPGVGHAFDTVAIISWHIHRQIPEALDLNAERARLAKEQADAAALKNAIEREEWAPVTPLLSAVAGVFGEVRTRLLSLPRTLAPRVVGYESLPEIERLLDDGIRDGLAALSTPDVLRASGLSEDAIAAASADWEPVGGHLPAD